MYLSALLIPLTLFLTTYAEPLAPSKALPAGTKYAKQFRRSPSHLVARLDVDPKLVCGDNYNDCGNGWCCSSGSTCAGELYDIPMCKDPSITDSPLEGTMPATPFENVDGALSSLNSVLDQLTAGVVPSQFATNTGKPASGQQTDGASVMGPGASGSMLGMVAAVWGFAAVGGGAWFLL